MRERLSFNVIHEPWIPVETKTGEIICVGIKDALNNAHEYRRVSAASPVFSFGIQRILIALLIDAYRPATINDLREIISKGYFDKRVLNSYISRCEADSNCFDLFDEKHPFLQTVFEEEETELIVKLFPNGLRAITMYILIMYTRIIMHFRPPNALRLYVLYPHLH